MEELRQTVEVILGQALNLVSDLVDFLWTSSISLPALTFVGINIIAFLLGLLLGRISKHGVPEVLDNRLMHLTQVCLVCTAKTWNTYSGVDNRHYRELSGHICKYGDHKRVFEPLVADLPLIFRIPSVSPPRLYVGGVSA